MQNKHKKKFMWASQPPGRGVKPVGTKSQVWQRINFCDFPEVPCIVGEKRFISSFTDQAKYSNFSKKGQSEHFNFFSDHGVGTVLDCNKFLKSITYWPTLSKIRVGPVKKNHPV